MTRSELLETRDIVAQASDFGVPGTKRFGKSEAPNLVVVFSRVYESELNGLSAAVVLEKYPQLLHADTQVAVVLVRNTEDGSKTNLNRLPVNGDFSAGDFPRAEALKRALSTFPVRLAIDVEENDDPETESGWLLATAGNGTFADSLPADFPHTILFRGITAQQERTGSRPFGTILECPSFESLTWPTSKNAGIKAALSSVFTPLANLGWLAKEVRLREVERTQLIYDVVDIVNVPDRTLTYTLSPAALAPFSFIGRGSPVATDSNNADVLMPCDGHLVLANPKPKGRDPFFYVVHQVDHRTDLIKTPVGL